MNVPLISVILPVYNGELYLKEAIHSILSQTWTDTELLIINDGSTDETASIISTFTDPRIRYFEQENRGLSEALNRGIVASRGKYIARQDSDDISLPCRLASQVAFLESSPTCGIVGTWSEIWRERQKTKKAHQHPGKNSLLQYELLFNNPFVHSSVLIRREVFELVGLYSTDPSRQPPEDYELWSRVAKRFDVANISEYLHIYRETKHSISREKWGKIMDVVVTISAENLAHAAGFSSPDLHCTNIAALANAVFDRIWNPDIAIMRKRFQDVTDALIQAFPADRELLKKRSNLRMRIITQNYIRYRLKKFMRGTASKKG